MQRYALIVAQCVVLVSLGPAQSRVSVGVLGGVQTSFGEFDGGTSLQATLLYRITDHLQLSLTSGYLTWQSNFAGDFRAIPLLTGVRVQAGDGDVVPYGKAEVGLYSTRTTSGAVVPLVSSGSVGVRPDTMGFPIPIDGRLLPLFQSRWHTTTFGYDLGLGVAVALSEQWSFDLSASVHYMDRTHPEVMVVDFPFGGGISSSSRYFTIFAAGVFVRL